MIGTRDMAAKSHLTTIYIYTKEKHMATVVKDTNIEWDAEPSSRRKFPWDEWTNGKTYQAVEDKDFASNVNSFVQQLRNRAEKDSLNIKTRIVRPEQGAPSVIFQFSKK